METQTKNSKKKEAGNGSVLVAVVYLFGFMMIGILCGIYFHDFSGGKYALAMVGAVLLAYVIFFLHIVLHEAGHMVCGLLSGYGFHSFRILSFTWQKDEDGKIRLYRYTIAGTAGQCIMEPPQTGTPYLLYNLGGILANGLLVLIAAGITFAAGGKGMLSFVCLCSVCIGIAVILANGIPFAGSGNDGRNILEIGRSKEARDAFFMQLRGIVLLKKGVRVKDFPKEWFVQPKEEALTDPICTVPAVLYCNWLFDRGETKKTKETIDELLTWEIPLHPVHRQSLKADAQFCEILGEARESECEKYRDAEYLKYAKAMKTYPAFARTEYAYQRLIRKNLEAAKNALHSFECACKQYPYPVEVEAEREYLRIVTEKMDDSSEETT